MSTIVVVLPAVKDNFRATVRGVSTALIQRKDKVTVVEIYIGTVRLLVIVPP